MCYEVRPAAGDIWFIIDPTGAVIGSCSSRADALGIVALVGGHVREPHTLQPEGPQPASEPRAPGDAPKPAPPSPAVRVRPEPFRPRPDSSAMFGWRGPRWRTQLRSFLRRCYRYLRGAA
jgi:hypothetical protein